MAASKKRKVVKQTFSPETRVVRQSKNPDEYYSLHPSWNFNTCDVEGSWAFTKNYIGELFWDEIFPRLQSWERQTWNDILLVSKKQNHSIDVTSLNPHAQTRLAERFIEKDSLISLRLNGTHRLYGYIVDSVFNVLWYDSNHGDNSECVCRSCKKHT